MSNGTVTRTVVEAKAFAWRVLGTKEDGTPDMEKVGGVIFRSTKPSKKEAFRALKNAGYTVSSALVSFEVVKESVYAQSLDTFIEHGTIVERLDNGRVKDAGSEE